MAENFLHIPVVVSAARQLPQRLLLVANTNDGGKFEDICSPSA
jgi:hypothetical protein